MPDPGADHAFVATLRRTVWIQKDMLDAYFGRPLDHDDVVVPGPLELPITKRRLFPVDPIITLSIRSNVTAEILFLIMFCCS